MSILSKLQSLLTAANTTTGESDTTLTDAVQTLVDGYGGSSDFSTATVTLNLIPPQGISIISELVDFGFSYGNASYRDNYGQVTNHNAEVLLYEGTGFIYSLSGQYIDPEYPDEPYTIWADPESATTTGNVVWNSSVGDWGAFVVTGDGTITANLIND